jgi:LPS O-antigen subunit length determinant protein (WzzB/FepE family)
MNNISLKEILELIWLEKLLFILIILAFAISSVFYALSLDNVYKSEAVLEVQSDHKSNIPMSGALASLRGYSSMANISLPGETSKTDFALELLKSRELFNQLLKNNNYLPMIIATDYYDPVSKNIIYNSKIYNQAEARWTRKPSGYKKAKPSYLEAHRFFKKQLLNISKDKETNYIHISIEHESPLFANELLTALIVTANQYTRMKDSEEAETSLNYLESELGNYGVTAIENSINEMIQTTLGKKMLTNVRKDYLLKTIDPPYIPERKHRPSRSLIAIFVTLLGGLISVFSILWKHKIIKI